MTAPFLARCAFPTRPLKFVLTRNDSGVWGDSDDPDGTPVLRSTELGLSGEWVIEAPATRRLSPAELRKGLLSAGDLVVTTSSGSPQHIGKTGLVTAEVAALGCAFSNFMQRLRPGPAAEPRFLFYCLNSGIGRPQMAFMGSTSTGLINLNGGILSNLEIPVPPLETQKAIADFLDRKTAAIDALIEKKQKLLDLLAEKRAAAINTLTTRGFAPQVRQESASRAEHFLPTVSADGRIHWLTQMPSHWRVVPSTWLFAESRERARADDQQLSATQAYGVIPQAEFERLERRRVVHVFRNLELRKHVRVDDFVISMRSFQGGLERARATGCIRSSYVVLRPSDSVHPSFFAYLFKSDAYIQALRATSNFIRDGQDLSFSNFRAVNLPLVPMAEQRSIAAALDREISGVDRLRHSLAAAVASLQEYRQALITAAVTGQLDVGEAAA